jgi:hypothetical protein
VLERDLVQKSLIEERKGSRGSERIQGKEEEMITTGITVEEMTPEREETIIITDQSVRTLVSEGLGLLSSEMKPKPNRTSWGLI